MTKQPVVDPVRLFCLNCPPSIDLGGVRPTCVPKDPGLARAGLSFGDQISLRTYRNTLEIFQLIVTGQGEHLFGPMLGFYGARSEPDEYFRLIARFLVSSEPPLLEGTIDEVAANVKASVLTWKDRALEIARKGRG